MRDATRIKQLAENAIRALDYDTVADRAVVADNLVEIAKIAGTMDARTGTKDPSWWQRFRERLR